MLAHGNQLAFLRQIGGRKQLFVRDLIHPGVLDRQLTTVFSPWNLEEIATSPDEKIVVAATQDQGRSGLYTVKGVDRLEPISVGEARYPAISPDSRWLAFSSFQSGYWNLSLRNQATGATRRLTIAPCDQTEPAWLGDSRTLLYSSDCGRALGFTAICRRRFLP
jgi:Tol biopolymer transport system component